MAETTEGTGHSASSSSGTPPSPTISDDLAALFLNGDDLSQKHQQELEAHQRYLGGTVSETLDNPVQARVEECKVAPLFSGLVHVHAPPSTFAQYGLLAGTVSPFQHHDGSTNGQVNGDATHKQMDNRILLNVSPPWSAFICGSQGSGKSHTLSCMLESCLHPHETGKLDHPLTGIIFHYDAFTSYGSTQICEAAYLCSAGIPVKVLVSPTNYLTMKGQYENLPGVSRNKQPWVVPLQFQDYQLNIARILKLMAVSVQDGGLPLYVEVIIRILRQMAIEKQGASGLDYNDFRGRLNREGFSAAQNGPMKLRLDLLESFMVGKLAPPYVVKDTQRSWEFEPGCLTIVDLSCPFVDSNAACSLFNICLELFLGNRSSLGRVVALDEAHKFMDDSPSAVAFTESLLQVVRQQRHLATRVIIATQEPTISPSLLDLASMTIVHRFTSPAWFRALKDHLAGAAGIPLQRSKASGKDKMGRAEGGAGAVDEQRLFRQIVELNTGEALLFSPSAMLGQTEGNWGGAPQKLGTEHVKIRVRSRVTADGGKSLMAH